MATAPWFIRRTTHVHGTLRIRSATFELINRNTGECMMTITCNDHRLFAPATMTKQQAILNTRAVLDLPPLICGRDCECDTGKCLFS